MTCSNTKSTRYKFDRAVAAAGSLVPIGISIGSTGYEGLMAITVLIWLIRIIKLRDLDTHNIIKHPVVLPAAAVYLTIVLSLAINGAGGKGYLHDIAYARHLLYMLAMIDTSSRFPVWKYMFYGITAGFVYTMVNIAMVYTIGFDMVGKPLSRYTSKLKEGNRYPTMLTFYTMFFLSWGALDDMPNWKKRAAVLAAGTAGVFVLTLFQIRTLYLAFIAGVLLIICASIIRKRSWKLALVMILLFSLFGAWLYSTPFMHYLGSLYQRVFIWKVAFQMWADNPIFGVGISSFSEGYQNALATNPIKPFLAPDGKSYILDMKIYHAHNNILQVLSCTGILGMLASSWFSFKVMVQLSSCTKNHTLGFIAWPLLYFIISLTGYSIYTNWFVALAIFMATIISCSNMQFKQK